MATNGSKLSERPSADSAFGSGEFDEPFGSLHSTSAPTCQQVLRPQAATCSGRFGYATLKLLPFTNREKVGWLSADRTRGFIRIYEPNANSKASVVVPCKETTTIAEVATKFGVDSNNVFVQYNGSSIRRLSPDHRPLMLQTEYLKTIGFNAAEHMKSMGDSVLLGSLIRFFIGRPYFDDGFLGKPLTAECFVKRGRIFPNWTRNVCKLEGSHIFIYPGTKDTGDEGVVTIPLARAKLDEVHLKNHGRCIHIATSHTHSFYLAFDSTVDYNAWICRCITAAAKIPPIGDLSDLQLEYLPEQLFRVGSERLITELNLKKNLLKERPVIQESYTIGGPLGYLNDLSRLQSLRKLNLSDNDFKTFPKALLKLAALTDLNLSKNSIEEIPADISRLKSLKQLNMENNLLRWLPLELSDCDRLSQLELGFNLFTLMPETLVFLPSVCSWSLAGNNVRTVPAEFHAVKHVAKVNLRRNKLTEPFTFPPGCWENIVDLDLRDNFGLIEIDLRCLSSLRTLNCERMGLVSLQLNGTSLASLYINHNRFETINIMPVPQHLKVLEVSRNRIVKLPDWIADLKNVEKITCDHNYLTMLPRRMFVNLNCLRFLIANHNSLRELPSEIENSALEVLHLHHNRIRELPEEFLASAHRLRVLNLTQNRLRTLPNLNSFADLNKVQYLTLAANFLDDTCLDTALGYLRLKALDLSYNRLTSLHSSKWSHLTALEVVNVSGNRIVELPVSIFGLPKLSVVRAHSNCIKVAPDVSNSSKLKILDLSANALHSVDLNQLKSPELTQLDLTLNPKLHISDGTTQAICNQSKARAVSVMNVASELQTNPGRKRKVDWMCGYSETTGDRNRLCVYQIRQMKLSAAHTSSLFAVIDGGHNVDVAQQLRFDLPGLVINERNDERTGDTAVQLRRALLNAHCRLGDAGQKTGAACVAVLIEQRATDEYPRLVVVNAGHTEAVLCRKGHPTTLTFDHSFGRGRDGHSAHQDEYDRVRYTGGILTENNELNGATSCSRLLGNAFLYPSVIPDPYASMYHVGADDEFLIIANRSLWDVISKSEAVKRVRPISNPVLAAKHLQDIVSAYGQTENVSVIVIRLFHKTQLLPTATVVSRQNGDSAAQTSTTPTRQTAPHAQSLTHLYESDETLTDSDVKSEPPEKVYLERPNYYFEYKKRLKEYLAEEGDDESDCDPSPLPSTCAVDNDQAADEQIERSKLVNKLIANSFHEELSRRSPSERPTLARDGNASPQLLEVEMVRDREKFDRSKTEIQTRLRLRTPHDHDQCGGATTDAESVLM